VLRTRLVEIDIDALFGSDGPSGSGNALTLNLFEDVSFAATADQIETRPPDGVIWQGHIEGVTGSQVMFVIKGETLSGEVKLPGAVYQVRYADESVYAIYEIKQIWIF